MGPNFSMIAYEAYCKKTNYRSLATGDQLPAWDQLPQGIQDAWQAASEAVVAAFVEDDRITHYKEGE